MVLSGVLEREPCREKQIMFRLMLPSLTRSMQLSYHSMAVRVGWFPMSGTSERKRGLRSIQMPRSANMRNTVLTATMIKVM